MDLLVFSLWQMAVWGPVLGSFCFEGTRLWAWSQSQCHPCQAARAPALHWPAPGRLAGVAHASDCFRRLRSRKMEPMYISKRCLLGCLVPNRAWDIKSENQKNMFYLYWVSRFPLSAINHNIEFPDSFHGHWQWPWPLPWPLPWLLLWQLPWRLREQPLER